jgi:hypothetical protein
MRLGVPCTKRMFVPRTPQLLEWAAKKFKRVAASQVVEDGVMRGRNNESVSNNTIMSSERLWHTLVHRRILGNVHRYREVEWRRMRTIRNASVNRRVFKAHLKSAIKRLPFRKITGDASVAQSTFAARDILRSMRAELVAKPRGGHETQLTKHNPLDHAQYHFCVCSLWIAFAPKGVWWQARSSCDVLLR